MWALLAPQITRALDAAEFDDIAPLEQRLASLFTPWIDGRIDAREFMRRLSIADAMHAERDPVYRKDQRKAIAYHEAGHAVAAHLLGGHVLEVTIEPRGDTAALGHVRYNLPPTDRIESACVVTLAGPLAQAMAGFVGGLERHRQECNAFVLDGRPGLSIAARLALLRYLEVRASEIVTARWREITCVAEMLQRFGTSDREEFLASLAAVDTSSVPAIIA